MEDNKPNLGGRPPIYPDTEENHKRVAELCDEYFELIKGEEAESEGDDKGISEAWKRKPEPPTVTGLTLHLGFENKSTLYDYAKKDGFSNPIKRALTRIEQYHEIAVAYGDKCTGNIFVLKNFDWKDSQSIDHTVTSETPIFKSNGLDG